MKTVLGQVSPQDAWLVGEAISNRLSSWPSWKSSRVVALFATLPGEVDTRPLLERSQREGKRLLLPRILADDTLEFAIVEGIESLRPGRFGVLEPDEGCPAQAIGEDTIVFVPGLAFDRRGGRLGRGAGYYDRALAESGPRSGRPRIIGMAFESQLVEIVPMGQGDIRMDGVITERGLVQCVTG